MVGWIENGWKTRDGRRWVNTADGIREMPSNPFTGMKKPAEPRNETPDTAGENS